MSFKYTFQINTCEYIVNSDDLTVYICIFYAYTVATTPNLKTNIIKLGRTRW